LVTNSENEQLRGIEHGQREPVAEIPRDGVPGGAGRSCVQLEDDFERLITLDAPIDTGT
jgi:hypothetical protein